MATQSCQQSQDAAGLPGGVSRFLALPNLAGNSVAPIVMLPRTGAGASSEFYTVSEAGCLSDIYRSDAANIPLTTRVKKSKVPTFLW